MKRPLRYDVLIFDMDNTLLKSSIDFPGIKQAVLKLLVETGLIPDDFPLQEHTIATLIESARPKNGYTSAVDAAVWEIVVQGEKTGMIGAELEPGVREVLQALHGRLPLTVLTNNARGAAMEALERTGIASCFEWVAGREQMTALKPSPSGVTYLLSRYSDVRPHRWLSIGDSWIDAAAARDGGVAFLAYNARMEELERRQLPTVGHIRSITELYEYLQA